MKVWMFVALSAPKYWLYLAGVYLVGIVLGAGSIAVFTEPLFWAFLVFFTFPANMWLFATEHYGNNFLSEISLEDSKKTKLSLTDKNTLRLWIGTAIVMFSWLLFLPISLSLKILLTLFMILPVLHNVPPTLIKRRFLLDMVSSLIYIIPGLIGFTHASGTLPSLLLIFGWGCWHFGLYLFSRIPETDFSKQKKLTTVEVLGKAQSLVSVFVVWLLTAITVVLYINWRPWIFFSFMYPLLALLPLIEPKVKVEQLSRMLPFINALLGVSIYWLVVMRFF